MKRFYKEVSLKKGATGYEILLDGRAIKTPAKNPLVVPTKAVADMIAAEWQAQEEVIDPKSMAVTRLVNSALDSVRQNRDHVVDEIAAYGGSDLICYRADDPVQLVDRQNEAWDPYHIWLAETWGVRLKVTSGIMPVSQDEDGQGVLKAAVAKQSDYMLAGLHTLVSIAGSLVLGLACLSGDFEPEDVFTASRVDEKWQAEVWGEDWEAGDRAAAKREEFLTAAAYIKALQ